MNQSEQPPKETSAITAEEVKRQQQKRLEDAITPPSSGYSGGRERYMPPLEHPLQPCDFKKWARRDSLSIEHACFVVLGFEPLPLHVLRFVQDTYNPSREPTWDEPPGYGDVLRSLQLSIEHGNISSRRIIEYPYTTQHVCWPELIRWARSKSYEIAPELESIVAKMAPVELAAPESQAAPELAPDASTGWALSKPQRFQGYGKPLYDLLNAAHIAGKACPKARDVLDEWKLKSPPEVLEVTNDGLKYYDAKGNAKPADLDAIRKAIGRLVS